MEINTPKELAENISRFVNTIGTDKNKEFIKYMAMEHRTLQQSFTRLCMEWIQHMASLPDTHIDLRNEASRALARRIVSHIEEEYGLPPSSYLPTV